VEVVCEDDIILKNEEYIMVSSLRGNQHLSMGAVAISNQQSAISNQHLSMGAVAISNQHLSMGAVAIST
jgi:hypothetical protein